MHLAPLILLAAVGVSAHPSGHVHMHRAFHEKRDGEVVTATIFGKVVSWTQPGSPFKQAHKPTPHTTAAAAATTTAAPAPASTAVADASSNAGSSAGTGQGVSVYEAFNCGSSKRASAEDIAFTGNLGCNGYGSNIKLIKPNIASKYKYTVKVSGAQSKQECKVWLKIGPSGGINGFFKGNEAKSFTLAPGAEQWLAFDENTQGGMCCHDDSVPVTSYGEWNCPWIEWDFGNAKNNEWSGFDASQLVAGSVGGPYKGVQVCTADKSVCSTLYEGGGGLNAFLPGDEAKDGIGGNIPAGPLCLHVDVGYHR